MKISKIFAGMSALTMAAAMAVTASAGAGTIGTAPDKWNGTGTDKANLLLIGAENDSPMFPHDDASKMANITTYKVTISGDGFDAEGWGTSGSLVVQGTKTGWGQHDFSLGTAALDADGAVKADANKDLKIYKSGDKYTIEYTDAEGIFKAEDASDTENYYQLYVQNFDDNAATWNIEGYAVLDADGNAIAEGGTIAGGDEWKPGSTTGGDNNSSSKADDNNSSSKADNNSSSKAGTTTTKANGTAANATTSKAAASDNTAATGATAGIALAGLAIAGAAVVISKRK